MHVQTGLTHSPRRILTIRNTLDVVSGWRRGKDPGPAFNAYYIFKTGSE